MTIEDLPPKLRVPGVVLVDPTKPYPPIRITLSETTMRILEQALLPVLERMEREGTGA